MDSKGSPLAQVSKAVRQRLVLGELSQVWGWLIMLKAALGLQLRVFLEEVSDSVVFAFHRCYCRCLLRFLPSIRPFR